MPIFMCRECGCVENTACSNYWSHTTIESKPAVCSACDPEIGQWHGRFERRPATGMLIDQNGQLWRTEEGLPKHYKILGVVLPADQSGDNNAIS